VDVQCRTNGLSARFGPFPLVCAQSVPGKAICYGNALSLSPTLARTRMYRIVRRDLMRL
jgi:hypothetical protein